MTTAAYHWNQTHAELFSGSHAETYGGSYGGLYGGPTAGLYGSHNGRQQFYTYTNEELYEQTDRPVMSAIYTDTEDDWTHESEGNLHRLSSGRPRLEVRGDDWQKSDEEDAVDFSTESRNKYPGHDIQRREKISVVDHLKPEGDFETRMQPAGGYPEHGHVERVKAVRYGDKIKPAGELSTVTESGNMYRHHEVVKPERYGAKSDALVREGAAVFEKSEAKDRFVEHDVVKSKSELVKRDSRLSEFGSASWSGPEGLSPVTEFRDRFKGVKGQRPGLVKTEASLKSKGDLGVSTESSEKFPKHQLEKRKPTKKQESSLKAEGDLLTSTEVRDRFSGKSHMNGKPQLPKISDKLMREGELVIVRENRNNFPAHKVEKLERRKAVTEYRPSGEFADQIESRVQYSAPVGANKRQLAQPKHNLKLEGEIRSSSAGFRKHDVKKPDKFRVKSSLKPTARVKASVTPPLGTGTASGREESSGQDPGGEVGEQMSEARRTYQGLAGRRRTKPSIQNNLKLEGQIEQVRESVERFPPHKTELTTKQRVQDLIRPQGAIRGPSEYNQRFTPISFKTRASTSQQKS